MTHNLNITHSSHRVAIFKVLIIALMFSLLALNTRAGTSATDGFTPLGLAKGTPAGTYALSGLDNINPYNGSLNFRLPLLKVGGRGSAQYTMMLAMELHWRVRQVQVTPTHQFIYIPSPNWWSDLDPGYGPGVMQGRLTGIDDSAFCFPDSMPSLTRLSFISPDGTEYELRDQQSGGKPSENQYEVICDQFGTLLSAEYFGTPHNRGRVFVSGDGSAMTFISDSDIHDYEGHFQVTMRPSGYLLFRDGTCYRVSAGLVQWIRDRNGNMLSFHYDCFNRVDTITDSLSRLVTITYAGTSCGGPGNAYDEIKFKGTNQADRSIKVWFDNLGNLQRSDAGDIGPGNNTIAQLFSNLYGAPQTEFNPKMYSSVELPNQKNYAFKYNRYGELAQVTLPTGGLFKYYFEAGWDGEPTSGGNAAYVYRRVVKRAVYTNANTLEGYMTFSKLGSNDYIQADQYNADGTSLLGRERHYYEGSATDSFLQEPTQLCTKTTVCTKSRWAAQKVNQ